MSSESHRILVACSNLASDAVLRPEVPLSMYVSTMVYMCMRTSAATMHVDRPHYASLASTVHQQLLHARGQMCTRPGIS